jgi:hypothetical protein
VKFTRKAHVSELTAPGDYCIARGNTRFPDGGMAQATAILNCPKCGTRMFCPHMVECEEPLTLSPSIVGPETSRDKVQCGCLHHFFVKNGESA